MKNITNTFKFTAIAIVVATTLVGCTQDKKNSDEATQTKQTSPKTLTSKDAQIFLDEVAQEMVALGVSGARAEWIYSNFITEDTSSLAAEANKPASSPTEPLRPNIPARQWSFSNQGLLSLWCVAALPKSQR